MTAAVDLFAWLPQYLRDVGRRWGFGAREGATLRAQIVAGTIWCSDGACVIDSGLPAAGSTPTLSATIEAIIARPRGRAQRPDPLHPGSAVYLVGDLPVHPSYVGLIEDLWRGSTWEAVDACEIDEDLRRRVPGIEHPLVVWHRGRPRAVVMPGRLWSGRGDARQVVNG